MHTGKKGDLAQQTPSQVFVHHERHELHDDRACATSIDGSQTLVLDSMSVLVSPMDDVFLIAGTLSCKGSSARTPNAKKTDATLHKANKAHRSRLTSRVLASVLYL